MWHGVGPVIDTHGTHTCAQVGAYSENVAGKVYQAASSALPRMILSAASGDEEMVQGMHDLLQQWTDAEQAEVLFSACRSTGGDVAVESPVSVRMWQRQSQRRPCTSAS